MYYTDVSFTTMEAIEIIFPEGEQAAKITKWRVSQNTTVSAGRVLFLYRNLASDNKDVQAAEKKFRSTRFGRVKKLLVEEGGIIQPGQVILTLAVCKHPTVIKDLCAECGMDLRVERTDKDGADVQVSQAVIPMLHSIPELKVCPELAQKIGKEDVQRLLQDRKLALLVDLDQTIVHTTNDNVPPNMKDVYHYQLYGPNSPWYHTRLRPHTRHFLSEMSHLYELHICTFGARNYAHTVAALLDKDGTLFSNRILSRDECFDPASKTANLKALFPCGDDMVCIIDDREDVWQGCGNLVQVKPYHFFRHTGDIHAPPGLEKNDSVSPRIEMAIDTSSKENNNGLPNIGEEEDNVDDSDNTSNKELSTKESTENNFIPVETRTAESTEDISNDVKSESSSVEKQVDNDKQRAPIIQTENNSEKDIKEKINEKERSNESDIVDEDDDDYLLYLEDILRRIHTEFYKDIENETGQRTLRVIIPRVRAQVLKGTCLTFSGIIPTNQKLEQSRAYKVARAFGAEVTQDLTENTTHLVAIKPGTAKVNMAKKRDNIKVVNPDWLWTCAERWEHVDERLFPLTMKARGSRVPPPHCSSPEHIEEQRDELRDTFADSINPLMSFTQEEIEIMDKEVEEDMEEQDAVEEQDVEIAIFDVDDMVEEHNKRTCPDDRDTESSSSDEEYTNSRKKKKCSSSDNDDDDIDDDDDDPVERFRRGENLPDDLDLGDNSQDSVEDLEPPDTEDDKEWNAMGAALEREFLSE